MGLRLKFGKEERVFRIEFISNQRIAPKEFQRWKEACEKANMTLPTLDFIKSKSSEIKKAVNYNYTSEDVEKIVQMKDRFKKNPVNYAMAKARMMKEKEIALANGDDERAAELESKLNAIEERAEELDKKRSGSISTIGLINDRNRKKNVEKAEAAIMEEIEYKKKHGVEDNPFTRRWSNPKMVTKKMDNAAQNEQKENIVKVSDTTISMVNKRKIEETKIAPIATGNDQADGNASASASTESDSFEPKKKKNKFGVPLPSSLHKEDLFEAHNFDIDLGDMNFDNFGAPGAPVAPTMAPSLNIKPGNPKESLPTSKNKHSLTNYKEKRGLP